MDSEGKTAFHLAAAKGNADCLRVMLTHGIDVSAQDISGHSALHLAVKNNHIECIKRLLQAKCPVESIDNAGKCPIHYAAANGCVASVQILCDQKSPMNVKDSDGNTPLLISVLHGHIEVCRYLLDYKADINIKDANERTPLILACESGNYNMVDTLLRGGADIRLTDALGHEALHYSKLAGNNQIVNLLLSKMNQEPGIMTPPKPIQHDQVTKLSSERSGTPKKRKAPPPPISPFQQSAMSSPRSSLSTPLTPKGQVFFPEQGNKDGNISNQQDYRDRLSGSTGDDSLLDGSSEAEHQEAIATLQAKIVSLTSINRDLQDKLQAKMNHEAVIDMSCDSFHSTQTELNVSVDSTQESVSPTVISENSDTSFQLNPETFINEQKLRQLEKTIEDMQTKLNESESEREKLEGQIQSLSSGFPRSFDPAEEEGSDIAVQPHSEDPEPHSDNLEPNLQRMSHVDQEVSNNETLLMQEELETLKKTYKDALLQCERKDNENKELQDQVDTMTATLANMVSTEKLKEVEKSYNSVIVKLNQENGQLREKYEEKVDDMMNLQKELESQIDLGSLEANRLEKEAMLKTIEALNKQVSELVLYSEAQNELGKAGQVLQDPSSSFIQKEEHVKLLQEVMDAKEKVELNLSTMASHHEKALEEICQLKQQLQEERANLPAVAEAVETLRGTVCSIEAERNELRERLCLEESKVKVLQEDLLQERSVVQETMVSRKVLEELQASLEEEIKVLSCEIGVLVKEKEKRSIEGAQAENEFAQLKEEKQIIESQLKARKEEVEDYHMKNTKAQEELIELKRFSENSLKAEEDKDKKISELSKEVSKLKEALNSLSQLSFSTSTPKRQSQQLEALQQQIKQLQSQLMETKKQHQEIISVYRMHLLYAVQGQMDEDVQKVLKQILMMCKSQPQKM
ncbi:hypothetical protein GDO86_002501 [Hymenochirus boettgeri]|uniref:Retinoic acid induced 14 n=1 Tax=Hymenochirus boettgeri TaxID=247094 RepID=A0A8T2KIL4_9PIPI|nr:hypothetical protein GDO86_002501 [Hymenochirus boettgeri]